MDPLLPDRFLFDSLTSAESSNLAGPNDGDHWMFRAGRRICPGMWVADRDIWLVISRLTWVFSLEAIPSHPIDLEEYDGLSGRLPVPLHIKLIPGHNNVDNMLRKAMAESGL